MMIYKNNNHNPSSEDHMNIFSRTYQSISSVNAFVKDNILSKVSPALLKAVLITAIAAAALMALWAIFRRTVNSNPVFSPVPPQQVNQIPKVAPTTHQTWRPAHQPWQPGNGTIPGVVPGQPVNPDPLASDEKLLELDEIEKKIDRLKGELKEERDILDLMAAHRGTLPADDVQTKKQPASNDTQQTDGKDQDSPPVAAPEDVKDEKDTQTVTGIDTTPDLLVPDANNQNLSMNGPTANNQGNMVSKAATVDPTTDPAAVNVQQPQPTVTNDTKSNLNNLPSKPNVTNSIDGLTETEAKIVELSSELDAVLTHYPTTLRDYLENRFKQNRSRKIDSQEIYEHVSKLTGYLASFPDNTQFILDALDHIDQFLTNSLFTSQTESCLQEEVKVDLIVFQEFFNIVDTHYQLIQQNNPDLALRLRIKLANLPLVDDNKDHASFKNIYLDEVDQSQILHDHFQKKEDAALDTVINDLKSLSGTYFNKSITTKEAKFLVREVVPQSSRLSQKNRQKLQDALTTQMGNKAPQNWDNAQKVNDAFKKYFTISQPFVGNNYNNYPNYNQNPQVTALSTLKCACIARKYFETSTDIPRWYHATNQMNVQPIIQSGEIQVQHRQAYRGAWVSTQPEYSMGDCVFVFRHRITALDPNVFIGYEKGKVRWRGLQAAIPMVEQKPSGKGKRDVIANVALVALSPGCKKAQKSNVVAALKAKGIDKPVVVGTDVIDYIHRESLLRIGNPNLSDNWWGKGDSKQLDHPLAQPAGG